ACIGRRRRVLRRRDARAAPEADCRGNRRPLLHAGERVGAARSGQLHRSRRDGGGRTRAVGHAGAADDAGRAGRRRVGVSPSERPGVTTAGPLASFSWFRGFVVSCVLLTVFGAKASAQESHLLVITGVGGDDEHSQTFHKWATAMIDAAKKKDGLPDDHIIYLSEKPELDPKRIQGKSTKENVQKAFADLAAKARPSDTVLIVLIGHGSFDGRLAAFSMPGPDLTASDFAALLGKLSTQKVAFVNTSSSSGAFLPTVAAPGRVVVTATKTGGERNETRFPEFFVEAFNDESADRDRNGRVSVAEAFEYAKAKAVKTYEQEGHILTEHATLDEGGGPGLAASLFIATPQNALKVDTSDPAMRALVDERDKLEREIAALKLMKPSMDGARYDAQMEKLLTELAIKTKEIRDRQARKEDDR